MERNANYALVGLASTLLMIGLILFSLWLAAFQFGQAYDHYDIVFKGPIRGLSRGGEVHFNGIRVGEVTAISHDTVDPTLVIARAEVASDVAIRVDSYAMLEPQGITGVNYIQITAGTASEKLLKSTVPKDVVPLIRSEPGALSDLLDGGGDILKQMTEAVERVNSVLSDENIKLFSITLKDIQSVTTELREHQSIIAEAQNALTSVDQAAQEVDQLAEQGNAMMTNDGGRAMEKLGDAATHIESAANDLRTLMEKLEGPAAEFATTGLPQITSAITSMQQAADTLDRTMNEVQQSPQGLIARPPAREIEVKP